MDKIVLAKTGDPWQDLGLVALYRDLLKIDDTILEEEDRLLEHVQLYPGHLEFQPVADGGEELKEALKDIQREKLNKIPLPPIEFKLLKRNDWNRRDERGFINGRYKETLSKGELDWLKQAEDESGHRKHALQNPQKNPEMTNMRNFIGLRGDWIKFIGSYEKEIDDFMDQQSLGIHPQKLKTCPLCGSEADPKAFRPMNQSRNVLFNQHHGVSVRGYTSSVSKGKMCPACNMLNFLSTIQVGWHAYFVSAQEVTHLLIPETLDLQTLDTLIKRMENQLLELQQDPSVTNYRSNLPELNQSARHRTLYVSLLNLYYWMEQVREGKTHRYLPLKYQTRAALKSWLIPRYSKGQVVNFRNFSRISADERHFQLIKPVYYGKSREKRGDVLHEFLLHIRSSEPRRVDNIAQGIIQQNLRLIGNSLFELLKSAKRNPQQNRLDPVGCAFFPDYLTYLNTEVDHVLSEQLQGNLRTLGHIIGNNCADDVSALTKLNNASSPESFIRALKEALFIIYKKALSSKKNPSAEPAEIRNIGSGKINDILTPLDEKNLPVIRDTLMIYVSINAFWALNDKKIKESGNHD